MGYVLLSLINFVFINVCKFLFRSADEIAIDLPVADYSEGLVST